MSKLPKFQITIDEEYSENGENLGIEMIANTSTPAIKIMGLAFKGQSKKLSTFADNLKYRIAGPIMVPGDIYRCDEDGFEYEVTFTSEEIEKIHSKFMLTNKSKDIFNIEHNANVVVPSFILEMFLVDSESKIKMIKDEYDLIVPLGSSFVVQQFTDKEKYYELVEEGKIGFSIEGYLGMKLNEHKNKLNKEKMAEETNTKLPKGEYVMVDKTYIVAEDGSFTIKEVELQEDKPKDVELELSCSPKEKEEMAEEPIVEDKPIVEEAPIVGDFYSKEEIDTKLQEIFKMIADLKVEEETEDVEDVPQVELKQDKSKFTALDSIRRYTSK